MLNLLYTVVIAGLTIPGAALFTFVAFRLVTWEKATENSRYAVFGTAALVLCGLFFGGSPLVALVASLTAGGTVVALLTGSDAKVVSALRTLVAQIG